MVAARRFLNLSPTFRGLVAMARAGATRVQLCGRLVVKLGGRRVQNPGPWLYDAPTNRFRHRCVAILEQ
jgi:hypothetical protein